MDYNIKQDLLLFRALFNISQEEMARELGIERLRIARTELGESYPREELIDLVYGYGFQKGLRLNLQKEKFYKEELEENHVLLTHASKNSQQTRVKIDKTRPNNDFGCGFYCGVSYEKAVSGICLQRSASVDFLDFNLEGLRGIKFEVGTEWMLALAYFRGKLDEYKNHRIIKKLENVVGGADYVIAPVADNRMIQVVDNFVDGEITDEQCKACLATTNLGIQYVLLTEKAMKNVKVLEKCYVSGKEKEFYQTAQMGFRRDGNDKSKEAKIRSRGKGKYIEEILK